MSFYISRPTTVNTATNVIGGISSVTSLNVSGLSTVSTLSGTSANFSGIVTASTFSGQVNAGVGTVTTFRSTNATTSNINVTGVATATTLNIDVVGSIVSGVLTTTSTTANQVLDSFSNNSFQTARYQVSIACTGQLVGSATSSSRLSVGSITAGVGYTQASFANVLLTGGSGNDARANIGIGVSYSYVGFTSATDLLVTTQDHSLPIGISTIAVSFASNIPNSSFTGFAVTAGSIYYVVGSGTSTLRVFNDASGTSQVTGIGITVFSGIGNTMTKPGGVSSVDIISPGSGYSVGNVLSASLGSLGSGFSFPVVSVVRNYQSSDLMILQNSGSVSPTSCDFMEYATIANDDILVTFSADISGSNSRLLISPTYRNNNIKFIRNSITI